MEDVFHYHFETKNAESTEILFGFFAIFDGHGGSEAAKFAKERLLKEITTRDGFWTDDDHQICQAIRDGFLSAHAAMWDEISGWPKTASGLPSTAGTTATVCFLRDSKLYIGHVGDSGVVMGKKDPDREDWITQRLTREHKPESPCEKARIEALGGAVVSKAGVQRVVWKRPKVLPPGQPGVMRKSTTIEHIPFLSVSRSLGDLWSYDYAKDDYYVCPEPDVHVLQINPHVHKVLILASDGLWNMLRPQDAVGCVQDVEREMEKRWFKTKTHTEPVALINPSQRLVRKAVARWRDLKMRADNTTALTILIDPPGPRKEEVVRRERHGRHLELVDGYSRTDYIIQNISMLRDLINSDDSDSSAAEATTASPKKLTNVTNTPAAAASGRRPSDSSSASTSSSASAGAVNGVASSKTKSGAKSAVTPASKDGEGGAEPERRREDSPRENREPSPADSASTEEGDVDDNDDDEEEEERDDENGEPEDSNEHRSETRSSSRKKGPAPVAAHSSTSPVAKVHASKPPLQKKCDNSTAGTHPRLKRSDNLLNSVAPKSASEDKPNETRSGSPLGFSTPPASSRSRGRAIASAKSRPSLPAALPAAKPAYDPNESQDDLDTPDLTRDPAGVLPGSSSDSQEKRINTRSVTKDNLPIGERTRTRVTKKRKLDGDCGGPHHEAESESLTALAPMDEQFVWDVPKKKARVSSGASEPTSPSKAGGRARRGTSESPSSPRRASAARPSPSTSGADAASRSRAASAPRSPAAAAATAVTNKKAAPAASKLPKLVGVKSEGKPSAAATTKIPPAKGGKAATTKAAASSTRPAQVGRRSLTTETAKSKIAKKKASTVASPASKAKGVAAAKNAAKKPMTNKNSAAGRRKTMHL